MIFDSLRGISEFSTQSSAASIWPKIGNILHCVIVYSDDPEL